MKFYSARDKQNHEFCIKVDGIQKKNVLRQPVSHTQRPHFSQPPCVWIVINSLIFLTFNVVGS